MVDIMKKKPLIDKSGNVRELTRGDIEKFRSADKVLPRALLEALSKRARGRRGAQKKPNKVNELTAWWSPPALKYLEPLWSFPAPCRPQRDSDRRARRLRNQ